MCPKSPSSLTNRNALSSQLRIPIHNSKRISRVSRIVRWKIHSHSGSARSICYTYTYPCHRREMVCAGSGKLNSFGMHRLCSSSDRSKLVIENTHSAPPQIVWDDIYLYVNL